ncbi:unnamed protein product [Gordionus sp. m RMFG-2023]
MNLCYLIISASIFHSTKAQCIYDQKGNGVCGDLSNIMTVKIFVDNYTSSLNYLYLIGANMSHLDEDLMVTTNMTKLVFNRVRLLLIHPKALAKCPRLHQLEFINSLAINMPMDFLIFASPVLKILVLRHNNIISFYFGSSSGHLVNTQVFTGIEILDLRDNDLRTLKVDLISTFPSMKSFKLSGNPLVCPCNDVNSPRLNIIKWISNMEYIDPSVKADLAMVTCRSPQCGNRTYPMLTSSLDVCPHTLRLDIMSEHSFNHVYIIFSLLLCLVAIKIVYTLMRALRTSRHNSEIKFRDIEEKYRASLASDKDLQKEGI